MAIVVDSCLAEFDAREKSLLSQFPHGCLLSQFQQNIVALVGGPCLSESDAKEKNLLQSISHGSLIPQF